MFTVKLLVEITMSTFHASDEGEAVLMCEQQLINKLDDIDAKVRCIEAKSEYIAPWKSINEFFTVKKGEKK